MCPLLGVHCTLCRMRPSEEVLIGGERVHVGREELNEISVARCPEVGL